MAQYVELPGGMRIVQCEGGYRHALDPFLLTGFVRMRKGAHVADLGTATGIMPLLLAEREPSACFVGVELQPQLADLARENVTINRLDEHIDIVNCDLRNLAVEKILGHEAFDVVVSNPPYRRLGTGKVAPESERAICRHEENGGLIDFVAAAYYLLKNGGRCFFVYIPERLPELLCELQKCRLEPKRLRMVHSRNDSAATLVLVEARRNGKPGLQVEPPLIIYDGNNYTTEVEALFAR